MLETVILAPLSLVLWATVMVMVPFSSQYLTALSRRMLKSSLTPSVSALAVTLSSILTIRLLLFCSITGRKALEASLASPVTSTSVRTTSFLSWILARLVMELTRLVIRSTWWIIDPVHSDSPYIISSTSVLAFMMVRGVFSS